MGYSGFWFVVTMSDETVERLRPSVKPVLERAAADPEAQADWQAWLEHPERVDVNPFWRMPLQDGDWMEDTGDSELVGSVSIRKLEPASLLFQGLGPARARLLPGFLGDFLLSSAELRATRTSIDSAFAFSESERPDALARIQVRLEHHLATNEADPEECLDLLPRAVEQAASAGRGLFSFNVAY